MKNIDPDLLKDLHNLNELKYCFKITLKNHLWPIYLTSASKKTVLQNTIFLPNSGLHIKESVFTESAQNYILIEGIFEVGGMQPNWDLTDAYFEIMILANDHLIPFVNYYCSLYVKGELDFTIKLEPQTTKYNRSLLNCFSKTCRTNFGDEKCKVNRELYKFTYDITVINGKFLEVQGPAHENGYFNDGEAIYYEENFVTKVRSFVNNIVELQEVPANLQVGKKITLIAGCDKKFQTCCIKFNNAVNFRGEPFIPENNFLDNF